MNKIVFLDRATIASQIELPLVYDNNQNECAIQSFDNTCAEEVAERLNQARVAIVNKVNISASILAACPSLEHIAVCATGTNNIDLNACRAHNVSVSNIPAYAAQSVAEHVITCLFTLRRRLLNYRQSHPNDAWTQSPIFCVFDAPIKDLNESTLGIIGFGSTGQRTAELASSLGMRVIFHSASVHNTDRFEQVDLDSLLRISDAISIHCPLTPQTQHLIGENELAKMQAHAVLINTARGGIVDESAVAKAIDCGQIGGLAFDVLTQEPPEPTHPLMQIAHRKNVIITPHCAWASDQAMQRLCAILSQNISAFFAGTPQNLVV